MQGPTGVQGPTGLAGVGALVGPADVINCPSGGVQVTDGNGNIAFACNGSNGVTGATGATGASGTTGQGAGTALSTTSVAVTAALGSVDVPGLTATVTTTSSSVIVISSDGAVRHNGVAGSNTLYVDIQLFVDASMMPVYARRVVVVTNGFSGVPTNWGFTTMVGGLAPGDHTFKIVAKFGMSSGGWLTSPAGGTPTATVAGMANDSIHRGSLTAIVLNK